MKVKELIAELAKVDPEADVKVKAEVVKNWECYAEWSNLEDVYDYGDNVQLSGDD